MKIFIKLYGSLEKYLPAGRRELEFDQEATVRDVLDRLPIPAHLNLLIAVNGVRTTSNHRLRDGDRMVIFPPVSGG